MNDRRYLSIGEVLGLLLEEFPDVTISKIRFLESQGLIDPERTASGYRKFYDADVERLRVILREQRENFLPLKVIKDRLDSGELVRPVDPTPTGGIRVPRPRGAAWFDSGGNGAEPVPATPDSVPVLSDPVPAVPDPVVAKEPDPEPTPEPSPEPTPEPIPEPTLERPVPVAPVRNRRPGAIAVPEGSATDDEICALVGVDKAFLADLESYGLVAPRSLGTVKIYDPDGVAVVEAAAGLCRRGLEPRHLRQWRTSVDREVALIEQLVVPLMRQRNPKANEHAGTLAQEVEQLGAELRAALARAALRRLLG